MWAIWIFVLSVALSIAGTYLLPEPPLVMYDDFLPSPDRGMMSWRSKSE